MTATDLPECLCVGSIILDDIVYPDGRTRMEVLGGGGVHTAAGMRVWGARPGLLACIGHDLSPALAARLERDFDLRAAVRLDLPQARAWQVFEWDGRRTEIFRVQQPEPFLRGPYPEDVPASFRAVPALTVLRDAAEFQRWRQAFPEAVILWEPEQAFMTAANRRAFQAALPLADIVSPNLLEASLLYGLTDPAALVRAMLDDGAPMAALRLGEAGSLLGRAGEAALIAVPAVPVPQVVDQTGAGNAFCGGLLLGWLRTHDLRTAGCWGAVAASFTLEQVGVPDLLPEAIAAERDARLAWALARAGA